jgi:hypothetical protein
MASIISSGTTSGTALNMSGDTSGVLQLATNGTTTALTLDASQNATFAGTLTTTGITNSGVATATRFNPTGSSVTGNGMYLPAANSVGFSTSSAERMRIDSSGAITIGDTSAYAKFAVRGFSGTSGSYNLVSHFGDGVSGNSAYIVQGGVSSNTVGLFSDSGSLTFGTGFTEQMRIDSAGRIQVSGTTIVDSARISVIFTGANSTGVSMKHTNAAATLSTFQNSSGTTVGSITSSGTNVAYNTSSDYRLKENILPMTGALAKVALLKPVTYKWKVNGSDGEGFIAHELAEVCPNAVHGEKDAVDENDNIKAQGIDTSFLVATLTAALQETKALIDTQAETINALTARIVALEQA